MKSIYILPLVYLICAMVSLTVLNSIAPAVVGLQAFFFALGVGVFLIVSTIHFSWWKKLTPLLFLGIILALSSTLVLGNITRGSTRWISLGPVNIQPSQFALPITLLMYSYLLQRWSLKNFKEIILSSAIIAIPIALIFIEPDLDTTIILCASLAMILIHSDIPIRYIVSGFCAVAFVGIVGWQFLLHPYQKDRITSFLSSSNINDASYNAKQSMVAVGSGQFTGRGLGHGVQSQLRFLPERQTDFIFASLSEETGFLGAGIVLTMYVGLIAFLTRLFLRLKDACKRFFVLGATTLLSLQIFVNVGMNMGILPISGLTLPLISYGGSSLLGFALLLSLVQRIVIEEQYSKVREIR